MRIFKHIHTQIKIVRYLHQASREMAKCSSCSSRDLRIYLPLLRSSRVYTRCIIVLSVYFGIPCGRLSLVLVNQTAWNSLFSFLVHKRRGAESSRLSLPPFLPFLLFFFHFSPFFLLLSFSLFLLSINRRNFG